MTSKDADLNNKYCATEQPFLQFMDDFENYYRNYRKNKVHRCRPRNLPHRHNNIFLEHTEQNLL